MSISIGLDWDDTVTREPEGFYNFVKSMRDLGHKVYIVTMRYPSECMNIPRQWINAVDGVYPTSRGSKLKHMTEAGIKIDIWIDDNPIAVYKTAAEIWGCSTPEQTQALTA